MKKSYAEIEIDPSLCTGCAMCVAVCPQSVLAVKKTTDRPHAVTVWSVKCTGCGTCAAICTNNAIEIETFRFMPALV